MSDRTRNGFNDFAFNGRPRQTVVAVQPRRPIPPPQRRLISDYKPYKRPGVSPRETLPRPVHSYLGPQQPILIPIGSQEAPAATMPPNRARRPKTQLALMGMAGVVFMVGLIVSGQAFRTNHLAAAQVSALAKQVSKPSSGSNQNSSVPNTTPPSASAISQYTVAPDLPRYLKIPQLGIDARVLQTGINSSGAIGTPDNVFDTAWYSGSAKPGQPGAMLIDGHVSGWTTHGVFYNLNKLAAGDLISIVRGDNSVINYHVVKTQAYPASRVNMAAALSPITTGKPGLNLITCAGQVEKGTSQYSQRIVVFAQQD
jgi:sortase (surface protein transpeptidase)